MGVYPVKQIIIVRKDLGMKKGKLAAQVAHASLSAFLRFSDRTEESIYVDLNRDEALKQWLSGSFAKIVVAVDSLEELNQCYQNAIAAEIPASYIEDNGVTVFNGVKTPTCVGVGPAKSEVLDSLFGQLKLY